jgi:hypothetical protein
MFFKWILFAVILLLSSCSYKGSHSCRTMSNETHYKAFIYQLTKNNVDFKVKENKLICLPSEMWDGENFAKLDNQVSTFYRGIAELFRNQEDITKVALWLETENIPHDFHVSSNGTLLVIYSANPIEAEKNKQKMYSVLNKD